MSACRRAKIDADVGMQQQPGVRGDGHVRAVKGKAVGAGHGFADLSGRVSSDRKNRHWFFA
jgi:hypothetical protein